MQSRVQFEGARHNGSLWLDQASPLAPQPPRPLPASADVAIVGAGYTGLWTAYYLKRADPSLNVVVLEAEFVGFGASGRNGGWCLGAAWGVDRLVADPATRSRGLALQRALFDTVDEIGRVCTSEGIDAHFDRGGSLRMATAPLHADRQREELERRYALGFSEADYRWLDADAAAARLRMTPNHGALLFSHCAAIHPAHLVLGLGETVRRLGVPIFEATSVSRIEPGRLLTEHGPLRAARIVRATEGYTTGLPGQRRTLLPVYSMMVATEPLSDSRWQTIGLANRETFGDDRRVVIYGQRTRDGRLALGGRAGYEFGARRRRVVPPGHAMVQRVARLVAELFPQLADVRITHGWGGVLGIPRHWRPCVSYDRRTGLGWAGGYVGEGVAAANLAGRVMSDLLQERTSPLTELPWVNDVPPKWEPEPLRWLGARLTQLAAERADRVELQQNRPSRLWGRLFDALVG
jgi:glycine/D-amino acid oxidase-like deaminating enzyme